MDQENKSRWNACEDRQLGINKFKIFSGDAMAKNTKIEIEGKEISIHTYNQDDYISLTDMAKSQMQEAIIIKWLSLKSTIEYIGE